MAYFFSGSKELFDDLITEIGLPKIVITHKKSIVNVANLESYDHKKCRNAVYDTINWSSIPPLSKSDLLKYSEVEHIYLKMADRLGVLQSYQQRKDEYNKHLRFWIWKLSQFNFNFAFFENVPHEGYNFVLYSILVANKVKVITFYQLPVRPGKTYLLHSFSNIFKQGEEINKILKSGAFTKKPITPEISKKFQGYLDLTNPEIANIESFTRAKNFKLWSLTDKIEQTLNKIKKFRVYSIGDLKKLLAMRMGYDNYLASSKSLLRNYNRNTVNPSLNKPYIYFAFHYQPELSTSPIGGVFVDQVLACEILAFAAKKFNVLLYIKEHPRGAKGSYTRSHDAYNKLLNYDNVRLLPNKINTFELIDKSICASTITGSLGIEALMRKKPILMFGSRFYEACYGAFSVSSVNDVSRALSVIFKNEIQITNESINNFLYALDKVTFEGYTDNKDENIATVSLKKSNQNKIKMIKQLIM